MKFDLIPSSAATTAELHVFLEAHYNYGASFKVNYTQEYLDWFFKEGGFIGALSDNGKWVAVFCVSSFLLRFGNEEGAVFNSGPLCVHSEYRFKGLAQEVVSLSSEQIKLKYKLPIFGAGVKGVDKNTLFKNFGMYTCDKPIAPKSKAFSSYNIFLCPRGDFLNKFSTDEGFIYYYTQNIETREGVAQKWSVVTSYYTEGCWKDLLYKFSLGALKETDKILIFENIERKSKDLKGLGYEHFASYNFYVDSIKELPPHLLYYNFFLF